FEKLKEVIKSMPVQAFVVGGGLEIVKNVHVTYSSGFSVNFDDERWAVKLGDVVLIGNMNQ
ncbi:MAG: hypothetical protein RL171_1774, partial [Pseudomonadota bacterium]